MSEIVRMESVTPILYGVVKIRWQDGYEAAVDLRPVIARSELFAFLRTDPGRFSTVRLDEYGHTICWIDDEGDEIDLGAFALRQRAERQDQLLQLVG